MQLTRKILIEKQNPLWNYSHPRDVPDKLWFKVFNELMNLKDSETLDYIASQIISPLRKETNYKIGKSLYKSTIFGNKEYYQIIFNNSYNSFTIGVPIELLGNLRQYFTKEDVIWYVRNFIANWD